MNVNNWKSGASGVPAGSSPYPGWRPVHAGVFDGRVWFRYDSTGVRPIVSITEGPVVALLQSDHPGWMVIAAETDRRSTARVDVEGVGSFVSAVPRTGMKSGSRPEAADGVPVPLCAADGRDTALTPWMPFRSAPEYGSGKTVTFAYTGDARQSRAGRFRFSRREQARDCAACR